MAGGCVNRQRGEQDKVSQFAPNAFRHYTAAGEKWAMTTSLCEEHHCALVQRGAAWIAAISYAWGKEAIMLAEGLCYR